MKSKNRAKAKEEQAMQSTNTTSKRCHRQVPFNSNEQASSLIPSHVKTRKPSQGHDKTRRGPSENLEAKILPKSPRLQQHFIKSHLNLDTTLEDEVRTPKSCKDSEAVQRT